MGGGVAEYETERHIFNFEEMKALKLFLNPSFMFSHVPCQGLGTLGIPLPIRSLSLIKSRPSDVTLLNVCYFKTILLVSKCFKPFQALVKKIKLSESLSSL